MIGNYNYGTGRRKSAVARVFIKTGTGKITVNGKAAKRKVTVDESILAAFASDLQARQSRNVRPFAGFDHKAGPASFIPKEFRYESGVGLVLDIEWTQAGKTAIDGKDRRIIQRNQYGHQTTNRTRSCCRGC